MTVPTVHPRDLEALERELAGASEALAGADELPEAIAELVRGIARELGEPGEASWRESVDPFLLVELQGIVLAALLALESPREKERLEGAELAVERMLDVLADVRESSALDDERSGRELARWLREATGVPNRELAELIGLSPRKLERWQSGETEPAGADEMRLRMAARLVGQLRHAMTGYGAFSWLGRAHPELDGRAPAELLGDAESAGRLFALASSARRSDAS